jgi:hypothetical protein
VSSYEQLGGFTKSSFVCKTDIYSELVAAVHATAAGKIYTSVKLRRQDSTG